MSHWVFGYMYVDGLLGNIILPICVLQNRQYGSDQEG